MPKLRSALPRMNEVRMRIASAGDVAGLIVLSMAILSAAAEVIPPFMPADRALFVEAAKAPRTAAVKAQASVRAAQLGRAESVDALDALIEAGDPELLLDYVNINFGGRKGAAYESRVLAHFDDPGIGPVLIAGVGEVTDPHLFERIYADAASLAAWRAKRRRDCRAQIVAIQPVKTINAPTISGFALGTARSARTDETFPTRTSGRLDVSASVHWRYVCGDGRADDPRTDIDGRIPGDDLRPWRDRLLASTSAVTRTHLPDTQERIAALFVDLSSYPRTDWSAFSGARDARMEIPAVRAPSSFLKYFEARQFSPPSREVLALLEQSAATGGVHDLAMIDDLFTVLMLNDDRRNTEFLAGWIERVAVAYPAAVRQEHLSRLVRMLGPVLPEAQIDVLALQGRLRQAGMSSPQLDRSFAEASKDNQSLAKPVPASFARWMFHPRGHQLVRYLLSHGADASAAPAPLPLVVATRSDIEMAHILLEHGTRVDARGSDGERALDIAVAQAENERTAGMLELLLSHGAVIDDADPRGRTALHHAVARPATLRRLLQAKPRVDVHDAGGDTPLMRAVESNQPESVRLLLDAGADPNSVNASWQSPYSAALLRANGKPDDMEALLRERGGIVTLTQRAQWARIEALGRAMGGMH